MAGSPPVAVLEMSDETLDLERRARGGEAAAFGLLIRRYDNDLRGVVWSVVRSSHITDDVMQAAYERAFRAISSFDGRSTMKTWLHSICYRAAIDHIRYESRRRHDPIDGEGGADVVRLPTGPSPHDEVSNRMELTHALGTLDPEQRAVMMLTSWLGYSFDETAEITGLRRGTVASKAGRGRRKLRRWETEGDRI